MEIKSVAPGSPLAAILGSACSEVLGLLGQGKAGLSPSIEKNFVVKLLFWMDQTVSGALQAWKPEHTRKAVFGNICKRQEYLFCYLLTLLGFDVLLLQWEQDIDAELERMGLSKRIGAEIAGHMAVPEYAPAQYQRSQAREVPAQYHGSQSGASTQCHGSQSGVPTQYHGSEGRAPAQYYGSEGGTPAQFHGSEGGMPAQFQQSQGGFPVQSQGSQGRMPVQNQRIQLRRGSGGARGNVEKRQKAEKAPAIVDVRIPERDRRTREMLRPKPQQSGQQPSGRYPDQSGRQVPGAFRQQGSQQGQIFNGNAGRQELPYEELALLASSVVMIMIHDAKGKPVGSGSGIMIGRDGYILTNSHVAFGGRSYSVRIEEDEQVYQTDEMIKYNSVLDLAIIRIQRELTPIPIYQGREKLVRGQKVVAIGSPLGLFNSVSDGIISGFRVIDDVDMIQFTAPISHGSSGGAVLNMYGEVIGISTAGIDSGQNINLAVGYEYIRTFVQGFL